MDLVALGSRIDWKHENWGESTAVLYNLCDLGCSAYI